MDTTIYILTVAAVGCGIVCGLDHNNFKGELQNNIENVLRSLAIVDTKERHKRTTNQRPADETLLISPENLEDIFKPGSVDKKEHNQQSSDLFSDPALRANIENLFEPVSTPEHTEEQYNQNKDQHSTDRSLLINRPIGRELETDFEKVSNENFKGSDQQRTSNYSAQQPKLQTMIKELFGPEIRTPSLERNNVGPEKSTNIQSQLPEDNDTATESGDDYRFQSKQLVRVRFRNFLQTTPDSEKTSLSNAAFTTTPKNEPTILHSVANVTANSTKIPDDAMISTEIPNRTVTSGWHAQKTSFLEYVMYSIISVLLLV